MLNEIIDCAFCGVSQWLLQPQLLFFGASQKWSSVFSIVHPLIFSHLDRRDLGRCSVVCREWKVWAIEAHVRGMKEAQSPLLGGARRHPKWVCAQVHVTIVELWKSKEEGVAPSSFAVAIAREERVRKAMWESDALRDELLRCLDRVPSSEIKRIVLEERSLLEAPKPEQIGNYVRVCREEFGFKEHWGEVILAKRKVLTQKQKWLLMCACARNNFVHEMNRLRDELPIEIEGVGRDESALFSLIQSGRWDIAKQWIDEHFAEAYDTLVIELISLLSGFYQFEGLDALFPGWIFRMEEKTLSSLLERACEAKEDQFAYSQVFLPLLHHPTKDISCLFEPTGHMANQFLFLNESDRAIQLFTQVVDVAQSVRQERGREGESLSEYIGYLGGLINAFEVQRQSRQSPLVLRYKRNRAFSYLSLDGD
ncbi:MAG: hypothetical protein S4CHLAM102_07020 [Chlamydiia bacterium]|nr:hypothetical protein [Chlamydiia bacterium]